MIWYKLDENHNPVPCTIQEWGAWETAENRRVARTIITEDVEVSTVFLGLDHSYNPDYGLELFETLVFGGPMDGDMHRYGSWDEAAAGHERVVAMMPKNKILEWKISGKWEDET